MEYFKVRCKTHKYETACDMSFGTAMSAAQMHSLLPCNTVEVIDKDEEVVVKGGVTVIPIEENQA